MYVLNLAAAAAVAAAAAAGPAASDLYPDAQAQGVPAET
jgi:hypothetical protein